MQNSLRINNIKPAASKNKKRFKFENAQKWE